MASSQLALNPFSLRRVELKPSPFERLDRRPSPLGLHDAVRHMSLTQQQVAQLVHKCSAEHLWTNVKLSVMWS
jgi:hypothetical protein